MNEVVSAIGQVTSIMGQISNASDEQSMGVSQVGEAVTQMDQVTQQNAALVEQMAAAASSLKSQAQDLVQTVAVFTIGTHNTRPAAGRLMLRVCLHKPKIVALAAESDGLRVFASADAALLVHGCRMG